MRTYTVVPSFEGESAHFDLPDIGFQGDHLSFAILFNLTELTEHWPNILPSMIVTDPQGNTYIAPHTSWNSNSHIFTWAISSTETTYEGYLRCQLKCTSADDPDTIVCMSRICQTRVYQSLEAASDPPEAFQTWIDTLVALGAQISADATEILESVETSRTNANTALAAADAAELSKNAAQQARNATEQVAQIAVSAQDAATQAQQRAQTAAADADAAKVDAIAAKEGAELALESMDNDIAAIERAASTAADAATQASTSMAGANTARQAAEAARDAAVAARGAAQTAQERTEHAEEGALAAQSGAQRAQAAAETAQATSEAALIGAQAAQTASETAQSAAETAQSAAEAARTRAETARDGVENYAELSRKWAEGKDRTGTDVPSTDDTYHNSSKYWAERAEAQAGVVLTYGLYVDAAGNGYIRSLT